MNPIQSKFYSIILGQMIVSIIMVGTWYLLSSGIVCKTLSKIGSDNIEKVFSFGKTNSIMQETIMFDKLFNVRG